MILCGGSANDLPVQGPQFARDFNTVDSFDTHAKIPEYFAAVDAAAKSGGNIALISIGWDPGLFSIMRLYAQSILPAGESFTFWGKGVSQGHSDAIRRIAGVADAVQYTIPLQDAIDKAKRGEGAGLTTRDKHIRECFVVAADGADKARIEREIEEMPNYFADYDTKVHFISAEELAANHSGMPHGGNVIHLGNTGKDNNQVIEYKLQLDSNPEFTASVLIAYARAAHRLSRQGQTGARTAFDIPPAMLSPVDADILRKDLL